LATAVTSFPDSNVSRILELEVFIFVLSVMLATVLLPCCLVLP
jgi:hypothetical protein